MLGHGNVDGAYLRALWLMLARLIPSKVIVSLTCICIDSFQQVENLSHGK